MNFNNKISIILSSIVFTILTGCGEGNTNNSETTKANNSPSIITIDSNKQTNTPLSLKVNQLIKNGYNTNNCFTLEAIDQNKNYKVSISSGTWYSTLQLSYTIKNSCNTFEGGDMIALLKGFKINNTNVSSNYISETGDVGTPWYQTYMTSLDQNGNYSINMLAPTCSGNSCDWTKMPANTTKTFTINYEFNGPISNYSIDSLTLDNNPKPPVVESGKINLNLDTTNIQDICKENGCNFKINYKSNGFESLINFDNTQNNYQIEGLKSGQYTFSVDNLESNISVEFQPQDTIIVSPNNTSNETILFKHAKPSSLSLIVKLNNIDDKDALLLKPTLKLIDETNNNYNNNCIITIGNTCTFNNIKANDTYHINLQPVANALSGNYYSYIPESFILTANTTKEISYNKLTDNLKSVTVTVNGLDSNTNSPNVVFTENDDINNFIYTKNQLNSGTYTFVTDHTIAINPVDTPNGYTFESVTPNVIHINNSALNVTVTYSKNGPTPPPTKGGILAGYLSTGYMGPSNNFVTIGQAAQIGYNVIILAFAKVSNHQDVSFYNNTQNVESVLGILAYDNGMSNDKCNKDAYNYMINDIKTAKENYNLKYVLASFGGSTSTISNDDLNNIDALAYNMITFKNKYHLDGFDFDLEVHIDGNKLDQLLKKLKQLDPSIILSAAPQMNTTNGANPYLVDLVTTGNERNYDIAVNNGDFDYIWAQSYNTGPDTNKIRYNNQDMDETMTDYIIAAYTYFTGNQAGNNYLKIPSNTTFILGEPATLEDGANKTIWNNPQYSNVNVYNELLKSYSKLSSPNAMTWTINRDILGNMDPTKASLGKCQFTKTLSPIITGKQIPDSLCPTNTNTYWVNVCKW